MNKDELELLQQVLQKALPLLDETMLKLIILGTVMAFKDDHKDIEEIKNSLKQILKEQVDRLQPNGIIQ